MERRTFSILGFALSLMAIVTFVMQIIISMVFFFISPSLIVDYPWLSFVLTMTFWVFGIPCFLLIARNLPKEAAGSRQALPAASLLGCYVLAMGATYILNIVGSTVNSALIFILKGSFEQSNPVADLIYGVPIWAVILFVCIGAPIFEELLFRKLLLDRLRPFGDRVAILCSALAFGLYHMNFTQFFYATAIGLLFGYIMVRTNRLEYAIGLHIAVNLTGSALPLSLDQYMSEDMSTILLLMLMGASITGGAVILVRSLRKIRLEPPRYLFSEPVGSKVVMGNAGVWVYLLICLSMFVVQAAMA